MEPVGAHQQIAFERFTARQTHSYSRCEMLVVHDFLAGVHVSPERVEQRLLKRGPRHRHGRARDDVANAIADEHLAALIADRRCAELLSGGASGFREFDVGQRAKCVLRERDTSANRAQLGRPFQDVEGAAGTTQGTAERQTADASAGDDDQRKLQTGAGDRSV